MKTPAPPAATDHEDDAEDQGDAPCRACVESPRLASPDFTVEIGLIAAR